MMKKRKMVAELESKIKDELKKELERRGAILDPDTLEKVSIMELDDNDGKEEWPGYPVQITHDNRAKGQEYYGELRKLENILEYTDSQPGDG